MIREEERYKEIGLNYWYLSRSGKFDPIGCKLADRHYSRRTPGSRQFMPPGQSIILIGKDLKSVWGWWRPSPDRFPTAQNGLDGWTCTIFRNEGSVLSSKLILDAEKAVSLLNYDIGLDGFITYIWGDMVKSTNPGFCFLCAGWEKTGWSADGRKRLLQKNRKK